MTDTQEHQDHIPATVPTADQQPPEQPDAQPQEPQQQSQDQQPEPKPEPTAAEKEAKALRRRVDRLTRQRYEHEARAQQLEQELQRYRQSQQGQDAPQPSAQQPTQPDVEARAREIVDSRDFNARCDAVVSQGTEKFGDFTDKVKELSQETPLFKPDGRPWPILENILEAEDPAALIYHLGSNPDVAAELAELTPRQQARRLVQIELEISGAPKAPTPPAAEPKAPAVTKAPPPIQPNRSAAGQFTKDPAQMSDAEWWASQRKS